MFEFVHWIYWHALCITCILQSSILNPDVSKIELPFQHFGWSWVLYACNQGQIVMPHHYTIDNFFKNVLWNNNN